MIGIDNFLKECEGLNVHIEHENGAFKSIWIDPGTFIINRLF